jgi:outer membrane protein OmpA-like peptidoglycan-associated protein
MKSRKREQPNYWMSYADLMSASLMVFVLLLSLVIYDFREYEAQKQKELEAQEEEILEKEDIIRQQLEDIIGVKSLIIQELTEAFKESGLNIEIDQSTGAIRFPGRILFATNSTQLSDEGGQFLQEFVPKYLKILMDDRFRGEIANILIEGHTDNVGTYMSNMDLSQGRAHIRYLSSYIVMNWLISVRKNWRSNLLQSMARATLSLLTTKLANTILSVHGELSSYSD